MQHLKKGDANLPSTPGCLRIYDMRFSPFGHRVRLILEYKQIAHEMVMCNVMEKPDFLVERHPSGKVPVLEIDGKILHESDIIADYLNDAYPQKPLYPRDRMEKAKMRLFIQKFNAAFDNIFKVMFSNGQDQEAMNAMTGALDEGEKYLKGNQFMGGEEISMADLMCWPLFERLFVALDESYFKWPQAKYPLLTAWEKRMSKLPFVEKLHVSPKHVARFYQGYRAGRPEFDME